MNAEGDFNLWNTKRHGYDAIEVKLSKRRSSFVVARPPRTRGTGDPADCQHKWWTFAPSWYGSICYARSARSAPPTVSNPLDTRVMSSNSTSCTRDDPSPKRTAAATLHRKKSLRQD